MTNTSACPFCNAVLPALATAPSAEKLPCPRCGEPVPAARWPVDAALQPSPTANAAIRADNSPGIRKTALTVLGIMAIMALIGLAYMLWTTSERQARHPWMPNKLEPIAFRHQLELEGLGYVPKGTQIVVGLQVAEWLSDPAGKKLLDEPRPWMLDWVLKQITRSTSLKIEQLDHVILASALDPQLVMIVKTRQPYSLPKIVDAVHPVNSTIYQEQPLYEFELKPAGRAMLWCVEERTMIFILRFDAPKLENLSGLSARPRKIEDALPAGVRTLLADRLPKHNLAWAVGRLDHAGLLTEMLPFLIGGNANLGWLRSTNAFALGIEPGDGLTLIGNFQMRDAKAAAKFKAILDNVKIDGAKSQKVETTPADAPEAWVTWQVRGDAATLRGLLDGGKK